MKKNGTRLILSFLVIFTGLLVFNTGRVAAVETEYLDVRVKNVSLSSVKLSWEKKSKAQKWVIKKSLLDKNGDPTGYKTVKTFKKNIKAYTVKKLKQNADYSFKVLGYVKKKGQYILAYNGDESATPGLAPGYWNDYEHEWPYSTTYITINGVAGEGLPFKGYQIYRKKVGDAKYKKIKTIKSKKSYFKFKDKSVKKGAIYKYKIRTYGKYKKKKVYSGFSEVLTKTACKMKGSYTIQLTEKKEDSFTILVKSRADNGYLTIKKNANLLLFGESGYMEDEDFFPICVKPTLNSWSSDGKTWQTGNATIKTGESAYLRFNYKPDYDVSIDTLDQCTLAAYADQTDEGIRYNHANSSLVFGLNGNGSATPDLGYYH